MKFTIMVVDDDPNLRVLLQQMLAFRGFVVVEAENGEDALEKMEQVHLDAIVLDVMMPVLDGITVCRRMRQNPKFKDVPVIMLSGKVHQAAVQEGLEAGATKYLCKPIPMTELIAEINSVLPVQQAPKSLLM